MSRRRELFVAGAAIGLTFVVVAGVYTAARQYLAGRPAPPARIAACPVHGSSHRAVFRGGVVAPRMITAKPCDTLTIANDDDQIRLVAFGPHDHHEPYDGVTEKVLSQHQSFTVVLDQAGSFSFHDHLDDNAIGYFTVAP